MSSHPEHGSGPVGPRAGPRIALVPEERERLLEERHRLAADLHDHVISRLFAAALNLDRVAGMLDSGPLAARLEVSVDGLDETISQLRRMIGRLQQEVPPLDGIAGADIAGADIAGADIAGADIAGADLIGRLLDVLAEASPALGFEPDLFLTGLDAPLPDDVDEDLLAVLREALINIARHARARSAEVEVAATDDRLVVTVTDDGAGIGAATPRSSGLDNLARRARDRHGTFSAVALRRSGTRVTWTVPLR